MNHSKYLRLSLIAFLAITFTSCENDDDDDTPPAVNEEELITDMVLTFTNTDDMSVSTFIFSDPDGPGGSTPTIDDIVLTDTAVYNVSVQVLDASNPGEVEDITPEVLDEGEVHQFFYIPNGGADNSLTVTYEPSEVDDDGNPIGVSTIWNTLQPTTDNETVRIVLRHNLDKNATGISINDFSAAGGETDIDVTFNLTVTD